MMARAEKKTAEDIQRVINTRKERRSRWEKEGERPLWKNLSMVGALGWLIVIPTLVGVFTGRWLDNLLDTGVTFSGALTLAGACLGFFLAWQRMNEK